jgi:putative flippase GtrA
MGFINDMLTKHREAILYVVCGGFTTLVTWFTYALFVWLGIELNASNILSWVCGVTFAFVVNKWIVFESKSLEILKVLKELVMFIGARIFTGVIAWVLFPILLWIGLDQTFLGTQGLIAKIIVSVIEIALNWIFSKYMIFKKEKAAQ